ncbi:MAG TPA: hypothetical protein VH599_09620 [Ktedonobacterales bacterium]|jgi:hypothetical protein
MPKKPPRHSSAQHRPQPKRKDVLLVRSSSTTSVAEAAEEEATAKSKPGATKTKPASAAPKAAERSTATVIKRPGTTTKSGAQPTRVLPGSQRAGRPGQRNAARPGQRLVVGRQANLVSAEHYRYVLKDLRLIGILAAVMFSIIIALTFILPHVLTY